MFFPLIFLQKSQKGDPMSMLKKQLEEKEKILQEGLLSYFPLIFSKHSAV